MEDLFEAMERNLGKAKKRKSRAIKSDDIETKFFDEVDVSSKPSRWFDLDHEAAAQLDEFDKGAGEVLNEELEKNGDEEI